ncbi:MAG TPA: hypothetical protein ENK98_05085 [Epsilonproteobacteria bacterium]|nr:hypothetical protein [Campylobacterota bacterium]
MLTLSSIFKNEFDERIILNEYSDRIIILKNIDNFNLDKIGQEVKNYFMKDYINKLRNPDARPSTSGNMSNILAFGASGHGKDGPLTNFRRIETSLLKEYLGYNPVSAANPSNNHISIDDLYHKHIKPLTSEEQQNLFDELYKTYGENLLRFPHISEKLPFVLIDALIETLKVNGAEYVYNIVLRLFNKSKQDFFKLFMEKVLPNIKPGGTRTVLRQALSIIGMHLHKHGVILLPFMWIKEFWYDKNQVDDISLQEAAISEMSSHIQQSIAFYQEKMQQNNDSYISTIIGLFLCTNIKGFKQFTPILEYTIVGTLKKGQSTIVKKDFKKLRLLASASGGITTWIDYKPPISFRDSMHINIVAKYTLASEYENEFGKIIKLNEHMDRVVVLKDIDLLILDRIGKEVKDYIMQKHIESLHNVSVKNSNERSEEDQVIMAFQPHRVRGSLTRFKRVKIELLKEYFGYNSTPANYSSDNTITVHDLFFKHIKPLTIKEQQNLFYELFKIYGEKLIHFSEKRESFQLEVIDALITSMKTMGIEYVYNTAFMFNKQSGFFHKFIGLLFNGKNIGPNGTNKDLLRALTLVGMQLHKYGAILLPFMMIKDMWKEKEIYQPVSLMMTPNAKRALDTYRILEEQYSEITIYTEYDTVIGIFLCSTVDSLKEFTPKLKYLIYNIASRTKRYAYITQVNTHLNRIKYFVTATGNITNWVDYEPDKDSTDFTYFDTLYKDYPQFQEWIKLANIYLSEEIAQKRKSVDQFEKAIKFWLEFLATLKKPPLTPMDTQRKEHIRDVSNPGSLKHFFYYSETWKRNSRYKNDAIRKVEKFFDYIRDNFYPSLPKLLSQNDRYYSGSQPNKTVRKRIPRSLLAIAKSFLLDNPSYIKTFKGSNVIMYNQQSEKWEQGWWLGHKYLMTIMLFLPIRNKEGRWLDSGELDEFIIDYEKMDYIKNPSPYAIKGRKSCVLQIEKDPVTYEKYFVVYVSTNKTGSPYIIPYAPPEVIEAIKGMQEFNKKWGTPVIELSKAVDRKGKDINKTSKLYPEVCPLFRMPPSTGRISLDQAISAESLMSFFVYLLEGIENILKNEGREITLVTKNGQYKKPMFDIHSLRVTGISELIEAGVPVDIVSEFVAGHANQVMTLYYNVMKHTRVKETLEKARKDIDINSSIEDLLDDLDGFEDYILVNETDGDKTMAMNLMSEEDSFPEISLDGICPGAVCSEFGREDQCCPKCPVWITGPAFLVGQTLKINKLIYLVRKKAEELTSYRKKRITENNMLRKQNLEADEEFATEQLEQLLSEWGLRYRFIQRSMAIVDNYKEYSSGGKTNNKMALITTNTTLPKVKLEESDELGILNHICQAGAIFQEVAVQEAQYDLEYLLNQLLQKNGVLPFLVFLDKETAKKTSLMLVDELLAKYNSSTLLEMIDGDKSLDEKDIENISHHKRNIDNTLTNNKFHLETDHG